MSVDEKRVARRAPVVLRIKLRYDSVDNFVQKFATNLSPGGMFISTRTPKPPGTAIKFELRLADDSQVIAGSGNVFIDLGFDEAKARVMALRVELMMRLRERLQEKGYTQVEAAKHLGMTQPRVSALLKGAWKDFSMDMLLTLATRAGLKPELHLTNAEKRRAA